MTSNQKAIELVEKFKKLNVFTFNKDTNEVSKQCALICIEEMESQAMEIHSDYTELPPDNEIRFLEKVKQEIINYKL